MVNVLHFICPSGLFGAEMWILALAKHLDPKQVTCRLAVSHESASQNLELFQKFRDLGLSADKIRMKGRFDFRAVAKLKAPIQHEQIDVLHTHGYKSDILGLLAARMAGIRALSTPHGFENVNDLKLQSFIRVGNVALKHFDRAAPLSERLVEDMARIRVPENKIRLIQNGVDLQEVNQEIQRPFEPVLRSEEKKSIGYVGQLSHRKNLDDMIDAFDLFCRDHANVRLLLVGDGPKRIELQQKAYALECGDRIEFLGYRSDRLSVVKELDLFCMTSSMEGMAMRVPVAAFDIPGVEELIVDGDTGLLAPFGDIQALKTCWERLLFTKDLASTLAKNGQAHVTRKFSAKRMAEEYTKLYREMVSSEVPLARHRL